MVSSVLTTSLVMFIAVCNDVWLLVFLVMSLVVSVVVCVDVSFVVFLVVNRCFLRRAQERDQSTNPDDDWSGKLWMSFSGSLHHGPRKACYVRAGLVGGFGIARCVEAACFWCVVGRVPQR